MVARNWLSKFSRRCFSAKPFYSSSSSYSSSNGNPKLQQQETTYNNNNSSNNSGVEDVSSSRPLSAILKDLNKKVPESLLRHRTESGVKVKYIPWHILNRIMNLYAPEWSGEVRIITYSADGKSVSVVYRVTLYGTDAEIFRESTGTALIGDSGYGDPVQKAEAMAFRRACARLGLGLHLYHEDLE